MRGSDCPDRKELLAYALGTLPEEEAQRLERHLATCQACESTLHSLETASDPVLEALRRPGAKAVEESHSSPSFQAAVERAKALRVAAAPQPAASGAAQPATSTPAQGLQRFVEQLAQSGLMTRDAIVAFQKGLPAAKRPGDANALARVFDDHYSFP